MAEFNPSKKQASDFNNGNKYINEVDDVQADTINNLIESALYTQEEADSAKQTAQSAKDLADSVVKNAYVPPLVGMHHIQFYGEPTPAQIWAGTSWEIDTAYRGRTIIGSGDSYTLGTTGGETVHTLTLFEMPSHTHEPIPAVGVNWSSVESISTFNLSDIQLYPDNKGRHVNTSPAGGSQPHNNMPPYLVVNFWKRTA